MERVLIITGTGYSSAWRVDSKGNLAGNIAWPKDYTLDRFLMENHAKMVVIFDGSYSQGHYHVRFKHDAFGRLTYSIDLVMTFEQASKLDGRFRHHCFKLAEGR